MQYFDASDKRENCILHRSVCKQFNNGCDGAGVRILAEVVVTWSNIDEGCGDSGCGRGGYKRR